MNLSGKGLRPVTGPLLFLMILRETVRPFNEIHFLKGVSKYGTYHTATGN